MPEESTRYSSMKFVEKVVLPIMKRYERKYRDMPTGPRIELEIRDSKHRGKGGELAVKLCISYGKKDTYNNIDTSRWVRHGEDKHFHKCCEVGWCSCSDEEKRKKIPKECLNI